MVIDALNFKHELKLCYFWQSLRWELTWIFWLAAFKKNSSVLIWCLRPVSIWIVTTLAKRKQCVDWDAMSSCDFLWVRVWKWRKAWLFPSYCPILLWFQLCVNNVSTCFDIKSHSRSWNAHGQVRSVTRQVPQTVCSSRGSVKVMARTGK